MLKRILTLVLLILIGSSGFGLLILASPWLQRMGQQYSSTVLGRMLMLAIGLVFFVIMTGALLLSLWLQAKWLPQSNTTRTLKVGKKEA